MGAAAAQQATRKFSTFKQTHPNKNQIKQERLQCTSSDHNLLS